MNYSGKALWSYFSDFMISKDWKQKDRQAIQTWLQFGFPWGGWRWEPGISHNIHIAVCLTEENRDVAALVRDSSGRYIFGIACWSDAARATDEAWVLKQSLLAVQESDQNVGNIKVSPHCDIRVAFHGFRTGDALPMRPKSTFELQFDIRELQCLQNAVTKNPAVVWTSSAIVVSESQHLPSVLPPQEEAAAPPLSAGLCFHLSFLVHGSGHIERTNPGLYIAMLQEHVNAPDNVLTTIAMADEALKIASTFSDVMTAAILDADQCKELKMGSWVLLNPPRFIHLCYRPPNGSAKMKLAIAGKEISAKRIDGGSGYGTRNVCPVQSSFVIVLAMANSKLKIGFKLGDVVYVLFNCHVAVKVRKVNADCNLQALDGQKLRLHGGEMVQTENLATNIWVNCVDCFMLRSKEDSKDRNELEAWLATDFSGG
ncbi:Leucine aminopeptidase 2 [Nymphaea thermarum]|nr:Leucine aminopeptidase 2 [Nymphaea thermarum]